MTEPNRHTTSQPITCCQTCRSDALESILFLGYIPPVNTMPAVGEISIEQPAYPLELLRCGNCSLVQIGLEVDAEVLFPHSYPYLSGTTGILRRNFEDLRDEATELVGLKSDDLVIDIGSNDGTLLANFRDAGQRTLGIEPSQAGDVARQNGIETLTAYFDPATAAKVRKEYGSAALVTAANVFAHIGDVHAVVEGVLEVLADDGVFVTESHYLLDLIETLQYDTIYHEHLRHYAVESLQNLFDFHGLEIFHVKRIPTHGGSIRVYAARKGQRDVLETVTAQLEEERTRGLSDGSALVTFRQRVVQSKSDLHALLATLKRDGAHIYGIGAPSRASTLVNYTGLDDGLIDCVMEVPGSHKLNRYVPGTRIPVLDEAKLYEDQPDYAMLLSWHIADELMPILRKNGFAGKFIVPLPEPRII